MAKSDGQDVGMRILAAWLCLTLPVLAQSNPVNPGFEEGQLGQPPPGWNVPAFSQSAGFSAKLTDQNPKSGARSAVITYSGEGTPSGAGNLMQGLDAASYRGKTVRFRASVRTDVTHRESRAQLWMRWDRREGRTGFFDNMQDRPIASAEWRVSEIVADVDEDAEKIFIGILSFGRGSVWFDEVSLQAVPREPARPLTEHGLKNLTAFTRLLGYVRFFHPSDQAARTNWDQFALTGVKAVEEAQSGRGLAQRLQDLFQPIAPTVRVFEAGHAPPLRPQPKAAGSKSTAWLHHGVSLSAGSAFPTPYSSRRLNVRGPGRSPQFGNLMRMLDATPYRGKKLRYRAAVRASVAGLGNQAQLWLRVDRANQQMGFFDNMQDRPVASAEWRVYEIAGEVAADAQAIAFGAFLAGEGSAWVDDVVLEVLEDGKAATPIPLANADFEAGPAGQAPDGWIFPTPGGRYSLSVVESGVRSGRRSALITTGAEALPDGLEPYQTDLGGGVTCSVPLVLQLDDEGTLPHIPVPEPSALPASPRDRTTRLAAVVLAWNVFQHFYPYFDVVPADWPSALQAALNAAATDRDEAAFLQTLRRMVAALHDGHGRVDPTRQPAGRFGPPVLWDWVEDQLVVSGGGNPRSQGLAQGDAVLRIDGVPASQAIADRESFISGATPQWIRRSALSDLVSGAKGQRIALEIEPFQERGRIWKVMLNLDTPVGTLTEPRPEKIKELEPGIWYLDLDRISDSEWQSALTQLEKAQGLVFDLRGYPKVSPEFLQHLSEQSLTSAQWLIPRVTRPDRIGMEYQRAGEWRLEPKKPFLRAARVFITDGRAISYAESCLGIVEHYHLGEIVGAPTAGTNGNVNPFTLPGGYRVTWTGMKVLKHNGSRHHGVGILPTVPVSRTRAGIASGQDELLERALQVLRAKMK